MKSVALRIIWCVVVGILLGAAPLMAEGEIEGTSAGATASASFHGDCEWPRWRGPNGDGIISVPGFLPDQSSMPTRSAWAVNIGEGYSPPAISGGRVYTLGHSNGRDTVRCLDVADGSEIWSHSYRAESGGYPGPRSSPTVYQGQVFTLSRDGTLLCLDAATGSVIWDRNISREYGAREPDWAYASSVIVYNDTLLINVNSAGLCLDITDGSRIWTSAAAPAGYATPVIAEIEGRTQALFFGRAGLSGVDPDDGTQLWHYEWRTGSNVNAADPQPFGNRIFISTAYGSGCAVIEINNNAPKTVWRGHTFASHFSSFVLHDGYLYGNDGNAGAGRSQFRCIDPDTGEVQWSATAAGMGSLIATDEHLVLFSERGHVVIAELTPEEYRPLAELDAERGVYWAAPVLCGNRLFLRDTYGMLYCFQFGR